MPRIKSFAALYPQPELAEKVVSYIEAMSISEAKEERSKNEISYLNLLVPDVKDVQHTNRHTSAFKAIKDNLNLYLSQGILLQDSQPSLYIIEITTEEESYVGIWALTHIDALLNNEIKAHEATHAERECYLANYLEHAKLDANPVLVMYRDKEEIGLVIDLTFKSRPLLDFTIPQGCHRVWRVEKKLEQGLINAFSEIETCYIADGHHRAAAAIQYASHMGESASLTNDAYFFSTVYTPLSAIKVLPFQRLIRGLNNLRVNEFLHMVRKNFHIHQVPSNDYRPVNGAFLMYLKGMMFCLMPKDHILEPKAFVRNLDVSLLHRYLLNPILDISADDDRINYVSIKDPLKLLNSVDIGEFDIAFMLAPPSAEQIVSVAESGETLPAKTTYIQPKFPVGLLVHKLT